MNKTEEHNHQIEMYLNNEEYAWLLQCCETYQISQSELCHALLARDLLKYVMNR